MKKHSSEPIKNKKDIQVVEKYLQEHNKRNFVIWVLGLNSGLRVSDIVRLNVGDVAKQTHITLIEKKTQKKKSFYINDKLKTILRDYVQDRQTNEPLFVGARGKRLDRSEVYRFIVKACKDVCIQAKVGTHTMRKTFGYHHYQQYKDSILLQKIFNHSSQRITLMYIGIEQDEIDLSYKNFEL